MESLSQAKVGSALQVFFNLDQLQQAVDSVLQQHLHELERSFKQALDSRHLSMTASAAAAGSTAAGTAAGSASSGPGGARGLVMPAPGAAGSWQVRKQLTPYELGVWVSFSACWVVGHVCGYLNHWWIAPICHFWLLEQQGYSRSVII
eukprot:GHUV01034417.1.p2 GENE.GHUV01034417.1~~GHUV01034417.1.p2  ORF type:complete len:148 (+),score=47.38 GHUV01034417.1:537-980(+)